MMLCSRCAYPIKLPPNLPFADVPWLCADCDEDLRCVDDYAHPYQEIDNEFDRCPQLPGTGFRDFR